MRILFTGGSSLTGYWFIKALAAKGHDVYATFRGKGDSYQEIRGQRVELVKKICKPIFECSFGSEAFLALIDREPHWDLLCHHAADVTDYKSPNFNALKALENNTSNLSAVLECLKTMNCRRILLTGSVFEENEGLGSDPERALSPYGLSKGLTSDFFRYYCLTQRMALGKFVIPNPFGPYEEPRLTSYLIHTWAKGLEAVIKTPEYVRDNIHVSLLALAYADFAEKIEETQPFTRLAPSGYIESQEAFVKRFAEAMRPRLGFSCDIAIQKQEAFPEPRIRINSQPIAADLLGWDEEAAWNELAAYYQALLLQHR